MKWAAHITGAEPGLKTNLLKQAGPKRWTGPGLIIQEGEQV